MTTHPTTRTLAVLGCAGVVAAWMGCAGPPSAPVIVHGQALVGLTETRLLECAGRPLRTMAHEGSTLLLYYREAPILEESFGGGGSPKSSFPRYHHGCWASLLVEQGRVTGVEFRPVPQTESDTHECQEIFAACAG